MKKSSFYPILRGVMKFVWFVVLCGLAAPVLFVLLFFNDDPSISSTGYLLMAFVLLPSVVCFVYWLPIWLYRFVTTKNRKKQPQKSTR